VGVVDETPVPHVRLCVVWTGLIQVTRRLIGRLTYMIGDSRLELGVVLDV
jgi:hypothetical protein